MDERGGRKKWNELRVRCVLVPDESIEAKTRGGGGGREEKEDWIESEKREDRLFPDNCFKGSNRLPDYERHTLI